MFAKSQPWWLTGLRHSTGLISCKSPVLCWSNWFRDSVGSDLVSWFLRCGQITQSEANTKWPFWHHEGFCVLFSCLLLTLIYPWSIPGSGICEILLVLLDTQKKSERTGSLFLDLTCLSINNCQLLMSHGNRFLKCEEARSFHMPLKQKARVSLEAPRSSSLIHRRTVFPGRAEEQPFPGSLLHFTALLTLR